MFLPVLLDEHRKLDDIIYPEKIILNNDIKFISNKNINSCLIILIWFIFYVS